MTSIRVTVWNEYRHERQNGEVAKLYPQGIHSVIAEFLRQAGAKVRTATLDQPRFGLPVEELDDTDVLIWWGHMAHHEVSDDLVEDLRARVNRGMGLVVLHSAHHSKLFKSLMGTTCDLRWNESGERERVWAAAPSHPIAQGVPVPFDIPQVEMYGEPFEIPAPDETVFISAYESLNVFRSGCCFKRGEGRIFYFSPGHETFPIYHQAEVQLIIRNATMWVGKTT